MVEEIPTKGFRSTTMGFIPYQKPYGLSDVCPCCRGTGTQRNKDGINIICPCCNGTGKRKIQFPIINYVM